MTSSDVGMAHLGEKNPPLTTPLKIHQEKHFQLQTPELLQFSSLKPKRDGTSRGHGQLFSSGSSAWAVPVNCSAAENKHLRFSSWWTLFPKKRLLG